MWRDQLDASFTVKQFVEEIKLWEKKGFVEPDIWTDLKPYIQPNLTGIISSIHSQDIQFYVFLQMYSALFQMLPTSVQTH